MNMSDEKYLSVRPFYYRKRLTDSARTHATRLIYKRYIYEQEIQASPPKDESQMIRLMRFVSA